MEQIGRYQILGELGRGATGVVYRAQDPAIGRIIAIKTIRLSDITDFTERERLRERLFREAQSAGILSHPNIVTIYDIAEENGLAYIFMECVDGPSLEKVMGNTDPMPGGGALSLLRQTAIALDYAHKKGIVHRDIKPANILIHEGTTAKITDFGVAKILSQQMTQHGVMMGTPNYMSPEQVQGHAVDGRADQFSLAVIAYEMFTGEKPFLADQLPALLFRIVREDPVAPERLNPSIGPRIEEVLKKALAKSANDRYGTCLEFVDALDSACHSSPGWHPMPRASAQNMPTLAGPVAQPPVHRPPVRDPDPPPAAPPPKQLAFDPAPALLREENERGNPLLKSLMWMLIGIGLVGLVLFGAQRYLFNRSAEPAPASADASTQPATPPPAGDNASKPSPIGQPKAPEQSAQATPPATPPDAAPEATTPETEPQTAPAQSTSNEPKRAEPPAAELRHKAERVVNAPPVVPPEPPQKASATQSIQFITEPPGAQVTVDGNGTQVCRTPCIMPLSPGRHALDVQLRGYRSYPKVINVPQDSDVFLQLAKATGTLSVTSNPPGATIEIDGLTQAKKTPALFDLAPGDYRVRVSRNGASLDFNVQLRDGEFQNKRVDF